MDNQLNRKFIPKDLNVRRKGDVDYCSSKTGLLALQWKDCNTITMLSTIHTAAIDGDKLSMAADYVYINSVTAGNQMASYYLTTRQSKVWYRKVIFV